MSDVRVSNGLRSGFWHQLVPQELRGQLPGSGGDYEDQGRGQGYRPYQSGTEVTTGGDCKPAISQERRMTMARETLREALAKELAMKAVMWGPATAGVILMGPVGLLLGAAVSVAIVASGDQGSK